MQAGYTISLLTCNCRCRQRFSTGQQARLLSAWEEVGKVTIRPAVWGQVRSEVSCLQILSGMERCCVWTLSCWAGYSLRGRCLLACTPTSLSALSTCLAKYRCGGGGSTVHAVVNRVWCNVLECRAV